MLTILDKILTAEVPELTEDMPSSEVCLLIMEQEPGILEMEVSPLDCLIALSSGHVLWEMFNADPIEQVKGFIRCDPRYSSVREGIIEFHMYLRSISHSSIDTAQLVDKFFDLFDLRTTEDVLDWTVVFTFLYGAVLQPQSASVHSNPRIA